LLGLKGLDAKNWRHKNKNGNSVSTHTIGNLCKIFDCTISEVMAYIPDEES